MYILHGFVFLHNTQLIFANGFCSVMCFVLPRNTSVPHVALHPLTSSEYTSPLCGPSAPFNTMMILHISYGFLSLLALLPSLTNKILQVLNSQEFHYQTTYHLPSCFCNPMGLYVLFCLLFLILFCFY